MFSCESSESNPPAEIIWQVRDQHGQDITEDMEVDKWIDRSGNNKCILMFIYINGIHLGT